MQHNQIVCLMLKHLLIENYALIEGLDINLEDKLTVISGETGAGKSILLGALSMILGKRADTQVLRDKQRKCIIEGTFSLKGIQVQDLFNEFDLDYDDNSIFRREITPQGKSRAFINDTPTTLQAMKTISEKLIDIHSQHESLLVGTSGFQFDVVDSFAKLLPKVIAYRSTFEEYKKEKQKLRELEAAEKEAKADLDYNRFQYEELEKATLNHEEYQNMEEELSVQKHAEDILFKLEKTLYLLRDDDINSIDSINEVNSMLKSVAGFGNNYNELSTRMESLLIELKDIVHEAEGLKESVVHDPERAAQLEARFDQVSKLLMKHSVSEVNDLIRIKEDYRKKIETTVSLEEDIHVLKQKINNTRKNLEYQALAISEGRIKAIPQIEAEVLGMLKSLAMPHARFTIKQERLDVLTPRGIDSLTFLFNANPGGELQDVSKVASGGELSRFMLSIKSMISEKTLLPTIIFDEIDTGISGETSTKVANILESMANRMQVIVITHVPQIASRGDTHLLVYKAVEKGQTHTFINKLSKEDRIFELAKMLGGEKPTKMMLETAKELIFKPRN